MYYLQFAPESILQKLHLNTNWCCFFSSSKNQQMLYKMFEIVFRVVCASTHDRQQTAFRLGDAVFPTHRYYSHCQCHHMSTGEKTRERYRIGLNQRFFFVWHAWHWPRNSVPRKCAVIVFSKFEIRFEIHSRYMCHFSAVHTEHTFTDDSSVLFTNLPNRNQFWNILVFILVRFALVWSSCVSYVCGIAGELVGLNLLQSNKTPENMVSGRIFISVRCTFHR